MELFATYPGYSERRPLAEFRPERHRAGAAFGRALVEAQTLLEGRAVQMQADGAVTVRRILHTVQADRICKYTNE